MGLGRIDEAAADLNFIREHSGALPPREDLTAENIVDELLRQRRYSLVFEGGHSWIDARRFDRFDTLPLANDSHVVHPRYPLPVAEVDAREGNITCVE